MAHPQLRNDFHKRSFLETALKDRQWALMVSANHEVMGMSYVQYRTILEKFQTKWRTFEGSQRADDSYSSTLRTSRWKIN